MVFRDFEDKKISHFLMSHDQVISQNQRATSYSYCNQGRSSSRKRNVRLFALSGITS
ncbi:hypothetical protein TcasGA2_TC031037 [Tribolium castaneum]|uniref:Uncharacterized protein n=1 Tax=Tribolium castaneum TaxID=7070 RepID=A0A139WLG8_TRICA|nr:hypothetical protein TcasGA2_TC031037 [Tribolium castaneum]